MAKKNSILWIICLVAADQGVKLIIANYFIDTKFDIIESILGFHPIFNDKYSYFNALLNLNLGLLPHAIYLIFVQFVVIFLYDYFKTVYSSKLNDIAFIFGQAALICVFCGFFFWKAGVLDFIYLHFWTVDLKDIYVNCYVIFVLFNCFKNYREIQVADLKIIDYIKKKRVSFKHK